MWNPTTRVANIDGDIVAYSCAAVTEDASKASAAYAAVREMLLNMRETLQLDDCRIFLSNSSSFRKAIAPSYKANRKDIKKPKWLEHTKDYLLQEWDAEVARYGLEADDELGINQTEDTILCTIDKDLDQVPGWHYNWRKYEVYSVSEDQAERWFWYQMLTGDSVDNIKGVKGIGPKKTAELLDEIPTEDLGNRVYEIYYMHDCDEYLANYAQLKILKQEQLENNYEDAHART